MRTTVVGRAVYDEGDVFIAQCPNNEAAEYIAAALDLMAWVRSGLAARDTLCLRVEQGLVEVGVLVENPDGFATDGRALTLDAAVREALEPKAGV